MTVDKYLQQAAKNGLLENAASHSKKCSSENYSQQPLTSSFYSVIVLKNFFLILSLKSFQEQHVWNCYFFLSEPVERSW